MRWAYFREYMQHTREQYGRCFSSPEPTQWMIPTHPCAPTFVGLFGVLAGQASVHRLQPMHASVTYRGFVRTVRVNFPGVRTASLTSAYVRRSTFGWLNTSFILGDRVHIAQSRVGNVLSKRAMFPPIVGPFSMRVTLWPRLPRRIEAWIPAIPAPITATPSWMEAVFTSRACRRRAFGTWAPTKGFRLSLGLP